MFDSHDPRGFGRLTGCLPKFSPWESVGLPANEAEAGSSKDFDYKRLYRNLASGDSQPNQWHGFKNQGRPNRYASTYNNKIGDLG